jgi:hypothetical protein
MKLGLEWHDTLVIGFGGNTQWMSLEVAYHQGTSKMIYSRHHFKIIIISPTTLILITQDAPLLELMNTILHHYLLAIYLLVAFLSSSFTSASLRLFFPLMTLFSSTYPLSPRMNPARGEVHDIKLLQQLDISVAAMHNLRYVPRHSVWCHT